MKQARPIKVDEKIKTSKEWVEETIDENGNIIEGHYEEKTKVIPIMGILYEEVNDIPNENTEPTPPTNEERIEALENALLEMILNGGAL